MQLANNNTQLASKSSVYIVPSLLISPLATENYIINIGEVETCIIQCHVVGSRSNVALLIMIEAI